MIIDGSFIANNYSVSEFASIDHSLFKIEKICISPIDRLIELDTFDYKLYSKIGELYNRARQADGRQGIEHYEESCIDP